MLFVRQNLTSKWILYVKRHMKYLMVMVGETKILCFFIWCLPLIYIFDIQVLLISRARFKISSLYATLFSQDTLMSSLYALYLLIFFFFGRHSLLAY